MIDHQKNNILSASTIKNMTVKNAVDVKIGQIEDIMIDFKVGKVVYMVLSVDAGFLKLGNKYFAIPIEAFSFENHLENVVTLNVEKEKLEHSPGFDKNNWPSGPQKELIDKVNAYYGIKNEKNAYPDADTDEAGVSQYETLRDNYKERKNTDSKESDFLG